MKLIWGAALAAMALATTPASAQEATATKDQREAAYAMTLMCLEATMSVAIKAEAAGDKATYEKLTQDGIVWLGVADSFGKELGRNAQEDFNGSVARVVAEGNLLGADVADARQKQVFDACQQFLDPAAK